MNSSPGLLVLWTILAFGLLSPRAQAEEVSPGESPESTILWVQIEKSRPLFPDPGVKPARWILVRIDGRLAGLTDWNGAFEATLPTGHYTVRSSGLRNRAHGRSVELNDGPGERILLHHRKRIIAEIFVTWPSLLFSRSQGPPSNYPGLD